VRQGQHHSVVAFGLDPNGPGEAVTMLRFLVIGQDPAVIMGGYADIGNIHAGVTDGFQDIGDKHSPKKLKTLRMEGLFLRVDRIWLSAW